jgi:NifU-like protein involved in Fe-S cluster formation
MNTLSYSDEVMDLFASPVHVYDKQEFNLMGHAGDTNIGEYVHLYFLIEKQPQYIDSKIIQAKFSVIGSVMLIAAAEKLCSLVEGRTWAQAVDICTFDNLKDTLSAPIGKTHSINYIVMAFYNALETLTNS